MIGDLIQDLRAHVQRSRARNRLLKANPGLFLGSGAVVINCRFGERNRIGDDSLVVDASFGRLSYTGHRSMIIRSEIGRFTSIAPDVMIGTGGHPVRESAALHPALYLARPELGWTFADTDRFAEYAPTFIGNDVWIGAKAIVRDGISIPNGVVVAAGAVVVRDLKPFGIYGGVPARLIRFRYPDPVIERLEAMAWWDRDDAWLRQHAHAFSDIDALLAAGDALDRR